MVLLFAATTLARAFEMFALAPGRRAEVVAAAVLLIVVEGPFLPLFDCAVALLETVLSFVLVCFAFVLLAFDVLLAASDEGDVEVGEAVLLLFVVGLLLPGGEDGDVA